jgi:glyoxylase-like metal-dependent hydrolase (beta-lactamase superfamily II)
MHPSEAEHAEQIAAMSRPGAFAEAMRIAGVPTELCAQMLEQLSHNRADYRPVESFQPMEGGERIAAKNGLLEVIATPGHSVGHLCLYSPEEKYLIAGDHLLKQITPNISWRPGEDMLARYLDSLEAVQPLDVDVVIPSHGKPFKDHRNLCRMLAIHHDERCRQILSYIAEKPMTAHSLVGRMWTRGLTPVHHHFAVMEVLAHLEYMRRRGPVSAEAGAGGAVEWRQS